MSRSRAAQDLLVLLWVVGCLGLGGLVREEVLGLTGLVTSVERVAGQAEGLAASVGSVEIPVLGDVLGPAAQDAREAGAQARRDARAARTSIEDLSTLLGIAVAILALGPVLAVYGPLRVRDARRRRAEAALAVRAREDPELGRLLAQRRLVTMPAGELARREDRPWGPRAGPGPR